METQLTDFFLEMRTLRLGRSIPRSTLPTAAATVARHNLPRQSLGFTTGLFGKAATRSFATEAANVIATSEALEDRDVVIVGGGVVGLALACKIGRAPG